MSKLDDYDNCSIETWNNRCLQDYMKLSTEVADTLISDHINTFKKIAKAIICNNVNINDKGSNLFLLNDFAGDKEAIVLLAEDGLSKVENEDYIVCVPSYENYIANHIEPYTNDFIGFAPVVIELDETKEGYKLKHNYKWRYLEDNNWRTFKYDNEFGLKFVE